MNAKFPEHRLPDFGDVLPGGLVLYSYLQARVPFTLQYRDSPKPPREL